ncbi:uncharacterized protein HMPREF1541_01711 [Cyphellophora europaea CBS 101466]|uniref:Uncharacterized protein n=1 Tax=Cyphellophora europaea (strain CBS 101466) TaxID=1220924 RepID=W2S3N4_CYPE1|nr:uncharacterized protein HMPREF1541_01711 [Cyphellophora europaea CBS 101466]ETN42554.1 hypothetical protein HMPREF1541_01711 [Cyphellophora europaea CBS 101466]
MDSPLSPMQRWSFSPGSAHHKRSSTSSTNSGLTFALQALLARHESYVAETHQDNERLNAKIAELEEERITLQNANEKIVAENKDLLVKLDTINKSYTESDSTVKSLEALLKDTELEVRRLNALARRAEELEAQVHDMERERTALSRQLSDSEQESRSAIGRWRESEKRLRQLELELEKIEWEAKHEMDKHQEVVARLERERVLERELGGAEGRLKGAAALQGIQSGNNDNVVSHFVRDILQDNATMQAGIVELRELLSSSNNEVQNLRQQIMHHQPIEDSETPNQSSPLPLDQQIGWEQPSQSDVQREVHVHHHYHAKLAAKGSRTPNIRKRHGRKTVMPGYLTTPESSVPSTPLSRPQRYPSSPVTSLQLHQPQPKKGNRWSVQSAATMSSTFSSLPSSPRSYFDRYSSIFDRIDPGEDSSRPTSPDTEPYKSPIMPQSEAQLSKQTRLDSFGGVLEDISEPPIPETSTPPVAPPIDETTPQTALRDRTSQDLTPKPSQILTPTPSQPIDMPTKQPEVTISVLSSPRSPQVQPLAPETQSVPQEFVIPDHDTPSPAPSPSVEETPSAPATPPRTPQPDNLPDEQEPFPASPGAISIRPTLRRSTSTDSLSIAGMDIHIPKRSSPEYTPQRIRAYFTPSQPPTSALTHLSTASKQPLTAIAATTASASQFNTLSSLRGGDEGRRGLETIFGSPAANPSRHPPHAEQPQTAGVGVAGRLGGWVRNKWGTAPTRSTGDLRSVSASHAVTPSRRPPLATLLEAPPPHTAPEVPKAQAHAEAATDADGGLDPTAVQRSPPRDVPRHASDRPASILTTSSGSTLGKRGTGSFAATGSMAVSVGAGASRRMPGINQKGAIPGFWIPQRAPSQVEVPVGRVDESALREGLAEDLR